MGAILIVDDTETSAAALELVCASIPGVRVTAVRSALDAVRILQEPPEPVSAVVTDIRMPRMDGFELIQFIRAQGRYAGMPIVVVTGDTDPDTPARSSRLGANAVFTKPFSPREVRKTLEELLHATHA
jgi:CheY-like chemotaxis protein